MLSGKTAGTFGVLVSSSISKTENTDGVVQSAWPNSGFLCLKHTKEIPMSSEHAWVNQGICCRLHATEWQRMSHMIVCPDCGDKRCPKAENCDNFCKDPSIPEPEGKQT